jgi:hypothetical protein
MWSSTSKLAVAGALAAVLAGCTQSTPTAAPVSSGSPTPPVADVLLAEQPADAKPVGDVRDAAEDGVDVTVFGRIGGSDHPWVDGRAAFSIVDPKVEPCHPSEGCPTPWDYCCKTDQLPGNRALIKIVDAAGETVEQDARQLLKVKELQTVVVKGKAKRDEAGNLTVLAEHVFVMPVMTEPK